MPCEGLTDKKQILEAFFDYGAPVDAIAFLLNMFTGDVEDVIREECNKLRKKKK